MEFISWHLFGDGWDEYYPTRKEAEKAYSQSDCPNLRLYKEISYDDDAPDEQYIRGRGDFPW